MVLELLEILFFILLVEFLNWKFCDQDGVLVEELRRLSCENRRLTETLTHLCDNYMVLQKQFTQLINTNFEQDQLESRKRKAETECCTNRFGVNGECSSITEDSFKKYKDFNSSPKVSKVLVKTEASNNSLVSSQTCDFNIFNFDPCLTLNNNTNWDLEFDFLV